MSSEVQINPYLLIASHPGAAKLVTRDLVKSSGEGRGLIAYGYRDNRNQIHYITQVEASANGWTQELLEQTSSISFEKHAAPEWDAQYVNWQGQQQMVLVARTKDALAASFILRKSLLQEIQDHFGTPSVGFGIPTQNVIIAGAQPEALVELVRAELAKAGPANYPGSDMIYLVRKGKVLAAAPLPPAPVIAVPAQEKKPLQLKEQAPVAEAPDPTAGGKKGLIGGAPKKKFSLPGKPGSTRQAIAAKEVEEVEEVEEKAPPARPSLRSAPASSRGSAPAAPAAGGSKKIIIPPKRK